MIGRPSVTFTPVVERVEFQRDQTLVMVHTQHAIPATGRRLIEYGVRRNRPGELCLAQIRRAGEFANGRFDVIDFLAP